MITLDEEHMASVAVNGLILNQGTKYLCSYLLLFLLYIYLLNVDPILLGFKESTISRRLRVKHHTARKKQTHPQNFEIASPSLKTELASTVFSSEYLIYMISLYFIYLM